MYLHTPSGSCHQWPWPGASRNFIVLVTSLSWLSKSSIWMMMNDDKCIRRGTHSNCQSSKQRKGQVWSDAYGSSYIWSLSLTHLRLIAVGHDSHTSVESIFWPTQSQTSHPLLSYQSWSFWTSSHPPAPRLLDESSFNPLSVIHSVRNGSLLPVFELPTLLVFTLWIALLGGMCFLILITALANKLLRRKIICGRKLRRFEIHFYQNLVFETRLFRLVEKFTSLLLLNPIV